MKHLILTILLLITCILAAETAPQQMNLLVPLSRALQLSYLFQKPGLSLSHLLPHL